jgi:hypothetical protein
VAAERSPSLVLLLRHGGRSAVPGGAKALPDEHQDELAPEAGPLAPHQEDAARSEPNAWDAWDGAHPDEAADAVRQHPVLLADAGAGKSAVPGPDGLVQDAFLALLPEQQAQAARDEAAVLCKRGADRSAAQSCAAQGAAALQQPAAAPDAAHSEQLAVQAVQKLSSMALPGQAGRPQPLSEPGVGLQAAQAELSLPGEPGQQAPQVSRREVEQPQAAAALERRAPQLEPAEQLKRAALPRGAQRSASAQPEVLPDALVAQPQLLSSA